MSRKMPIKAAAVAVALGAMTSVAWAEPIAMTDAQMDQVTAGILISLPQDTWIRYNGSFLLLRAGDYWADKKKIGPGVVQVPQPGVGSITNVTVPKDTWIRYNGSFLLLRAGDYWADKKKIGPGVVQVPQPGVGSITNETKSQQQSSSSQTGQSTQTTMVPGVGTIISNTKSQQQSSSSQTGQSTQTTTFKGPEVLAKIPTAVLMSTTLPR